MPPEFSRRRSPIVLATLCSIALGACLAWRAAEAAGPGMPAANAATAAPAASAPHVSPHILAAQRRARESAASEPLKVNPLMLHRPRVPRASGRAQ